MNERVAIIDDSLTVRMDLGEAFTEAGFDTVLCASAAEARRALAERPAALIVLDVVLPDGDGVELLAELRRQPFTENTPVVVLSTEDDVKARIRGLDQGANEYVGKPYDASYLVGRAIELVQRSAKPRAAPSILVIDDSVTYRQQLAAELEAAGYGVAVAESGSEGLRLAVAERPDAVVVDGLMPGMDGPTVVRKIRLDPGLQHTPCLLLTASEGSDTEILALDAGADAYVRKGEGVALVLTRLAAVLRATFVSREGEHPTSSLGPKRILAVDDSSTFLEEVAGELRAEGYEVVKARSGQEALDLLAAESVDCILLDLLMPGMSGTDTCRRIKSSPELRRIPLIMLTALEEPDAVIEGMNAGADDYVVKSVDFDVIKARVRAQLRRKHIEEESRRVREEMLAKDAEARVARETAEARATLLRRVEAKNRELEILNRELQMFAYSVSHDLRQPLRSIDGFSEVLLDRYGESLDERGRHYLTRLRAGAERMGELIDGLLALSRVTRKPLEHAALRLDELSWGVVERLREGDPERSVVIDIDEPIEAMGDAQLLESLLENLIGNAWKFTAKCGDPRIRVGVQATASAPIYLVADNGAGFDMAYADNLFAPFQRLHRASEFAGTGIGLATTQRIVHRHGGKIWAESKPNGGATFFFTLEPDRRDE